MPFPLRPPCSYKLFCNGMCVLRARCTRGHSRLFLPSSKLPDRGLSSPKTSPTGRPGDKKGPVLTSPCEIPTNAAVQGLWSGVVRHVPRQQGSSSHSEASMTGARMSSEAAVEGARVSYRATIVGTRTSSRAANVGTRMSSEAAEVGARMCCEATQAGTRIWAEPAFAAAQVKVEAAAADAFVPAEDAIARAKADAHATYISMGRAARLQEQSKGAAQRRRVSFGGVQTRAHLKKGRSTLRGRPHLNHVETLTHVHDCKITTSLNLVEDILWDRHGIPISLNRRSLSATEADLKFSFCLTNRSRWQPLYPPDSDRSARQCWACKMCQLQAPCTWRGTQTRLRTRSCTTRVISYSGRM